MNGPSPQELDEVYDALQRVRAIATCLQVFGDVNGQLGGEILTAPERTLRPLGDMLEDEAWKAVKILKPFTDPDEAPSAV